GEYAVHPRAFVVQRATRVASIDEGVARISEPSFDVRQEAVVRGEELPELLEGTAAPAQWERLWAEQMVVQAQGPGLLVVGEHFDPGWRATIDGRPARVAEADLAALAVVLPASAATVELRFVPVGLRPGIALALVATAALLGAEIARRRLARVA